VDTSIAYTNSISRTASFNAIVNESQQQFVVCKAEAQAWCGIAAISCRGNHLPIASAMRSSLIDAVTDDILASAHCRLRTYYT